jgi:hypothetical protein
MEELITSNISLNDLSDFHTQKFGKCPPQLQIMKIIEEYGETLDALSLDDMLKECCDLILAISGLFNAYDADINAYMKECLIKVMNRQYPDKFKHENIS